MLNHIRIIKKLKSLLPLGIKLLIIRLLVKIQYLLFNYFIPKKFKVYSKKRKLFVMLSTDYSNLGDHAMTYVHINMLKKNFPNYEIIELLVGDTLRNIKYLSKIIQSGDVITLKGGGNIGLEYFREELYRRIIIKKFNKNKIILFPQTIYFPNTNQGNREFLKTINIFNSHPEFYVNLRDSISYNLVKDKLRMHVQLMPDIVLSLGNLGLESARNGATVCLRSDVEGVYSKEEKDKIIEITSLKYKSVKVTDTVTEYPISKEDRESELYKIWNLFASSEIVITDRLHGMIFAAITSTPCIVFGTYNHKLSGQYKWIEHLNFIRFIDFDKVKIESAIDELKGIIVNPLNQERYQDLFDGIINDIRSGGGICHRK